MKKDLHREFPDAAMFTYWVNGSQQVEVHADPPRLECAHPFHVTGVTSWGIPISLLVFAEDGDHAIKRVKACIETVAKKDHDDDQYHKGRGDVDQGWGSGARAKRLLRDLKNGDMVLKARPYDVTRISCKVNWASNGGVT